MIKINDNIEDRLERVEKKLNKSIDILYSIINDPRAEEYDLVIEEIERWTYTIQIHDGNFEINISYDPIDEMFFIMASFHGYKKWFKYQTEEKAVDRIFELIENITYLKEDTKYILKEDIKVLNNTDFEYIIGNNADSLFNTVLEKGDVIRYINRDIGFDTEMFSDISDSKLNVLIKELDFRVKDLLKIKKEDEHDFPYIKSTDILNCIDLYNISAIRMGIFTQESQGSHCYSEELILETNDGTDIDLISLISDSKSLLDYFNDEQLNSGFVTTAEIKDLFDEELIKFIENNHMKIKWLSDPGRRHYTLVHLENNDDFPIGEDYST
jgi:archaellin